MMFVFIVLVSGVSAISIDLKESYERGESMILKVSGLITEPILEENIEFRRGHVLVPFDHGLVKLGDTYYIWAVASENENNYTLIIRDVATTVEGKPTQVDFMQNFSVSDVLSSYSVRPGAVFVRDDFELVVQLNEDLEKIIEIEGEDYTLRPGENKIDFSIANIYGTQVIEINVGKYSVPAYIIGGEAPIAGEQINVSEIGELPDLRFSPSNIKSTLMKGQTRSYVITISNSGNESVEDISFGFNEDVFEISDDFLDVDAGEEKNVSVSLKSGVDTNISEIIQIEYFGYTTQIPVEIGFVEELPSGAQVSLGGEQTGEFYCSDLGGVLCSADQECVGEERVTIEGRCCIGFCKKVEEESNVGLIVGIILILIVIVGSFIIFRRYRGVKKRAPLEEASKKSLP